MKAECMLSTDIYLTGLEVVSDGARRNHWGDVPIPTHES